MVVIFLFHAIHLCSIEVLGSMRWETSQTCRSAFLPRGCVYFADAMGHKIGSWEYRLQNDGFRLAVERTTNTQRLIDK